MYCNIFIIFFFRFYFIFFRDYLKLIYCNFEEKLNVKVVFFRIVLGLSFVLGILLF